MDPECLPFYLLQQITDNFSEGRKLGTGAYGDVYKGVKENGEEIAVKKLRYFNIELDDKQFEQEYNNLKMLQHPNIVRFVGYCYETQNRPHMFNGKQVFAGETYRALCFEYLHNGSLQNHLSDELDWHTRYRIIKGTCEGLRYIHEQTEPILHLDLKPGNILLDRDMVPKLADFGLSRIIGKELTSMITESAIGTRGYQPPEFIKGDVISKEFDIFSLGVVIIKIVTGPEGYPKYDGKPSEDFVYQVQQKWRNMLQATWSSSLLEAYCQQVEICIQIAYNCLEEDRHKRPKINDIIDRLDELESEISKLQGCQSMVLNQLNVKPLHLLFPSEPNKSMISCPLHLTNNTDDRVAFRLQIENLKEYFLGPLCGVVTPRSCYTLAVTMRHKLMLLPEFFKLESAIAGSEELTDFSSYTAMGEHDHFFTKAKQEGRDVQQMASGGDFQLRYRNLQLGSVNHIIPRQYPGANPVDVHPTEPWFLIKISRFVHIWNYETQEMVDYYHVNETSPVLDAKFIAREQWFVAGNRHGFTQVFSYNTKEETKSFKAHDFSVICLDIHPIMPYMLSAGHDHLIKLWDWGKDWKCVGKIDVQIQSAGRDNLINLIREVKFNPKDANNFACSYIDGLLQVWNISSSSSSSTLFDNESVECFDYLTRGDQVYLIIISWDKKARIWDFGSRKCVQILEGHTDCVSIVRSHPDHPILIMGSNDGTTSLWNSITFRLEGMLNFGLGMVSAIACLKGTGRIVIGHDDGIALTEVYHEPPEASM